MKIKKIVTCHQLGKIILTENIVPTPIYTVSRDKKFIVSIRYFKSNQKIKTKKSVKF